MANVSHILRCTMYLENTMGSSWVAMKQDGSGKQQYFTVLENKKNNPKPALLTHKDHPNRIFWFVVGPY